MNKYTPLVASIAGPLLLAGCGGGVGEQAAGSEHTAVLARLNALEAESEIRGKLQTYMAVLGASDWDNYVNYFTRDGKLIMTEGTRTGRDDIKERMSSAAARMAGAAQGRPARRRADLLSNIEIVVNGNTATAQSRFTFIGENAEGGFDVTGSGLYIDEWAFEEGEWRIAARTVDYDLLRAAPAPARALQPAPASAPVSAQPW
jgi:3-phenylpropionate/cinnamic acid dioxygenase small subunit